MGFDMEAMLRLATVPAELLPEGVAQEPVSEGLKYEDLMALLRRVEEQPYGSYGPPGPAPDDWFEGVRRPEETRAQTKSRIMLEEYSRAGRQVRDADLWALRAQYVRVRSYVQGSGGGRPYNTHDWIHFYSRYGSGGGREQSLMIGLRVDTVEEMGRMSMIESQSLWALRLLGH